MSCGIASEGLALYDDRADYPAGCRHGFVEEPRVPARDFVVVMDESALWDAAGFVDYACFRPVIYFEQGVVLLRSDVADCLLPSS